MSEENMIVLPQQAVWVDSQKNKKKLLMDPYSVPLYFKSKEANRAYYVCSRKKTHNCPVSVSLDVMADMIVRVNGTHTHDSDLVANAVKKVVAEKLEAAKANPTVSPRSVFSDITSEVLSNSNTAAGLSSIPKYKTLAKSIQRKRKLELDCPAIPKSWHEMKVPEQMKVTVDNEPFLIMEERIAGKDEVVWGFASSYGLDLMKKSDAFYGDGTFEMVKETKFSQVWVIVCPDSTISVPTAWFLLPNKEYTTYKMILNCLKNLGVEAPANFHVDFEAAAIKAIKEEYPESNIVGCTVHFKRCLRSHLQDKGLLHEYNSDSEVQTFIRYLWAMALVPPSQIVTVWEEFVMKNIVEADEDSADNDGEGDVARDYNMAMESFIKYFEGTWIGLVNSRTGMRKRPKFEHKVWNKFTAIMADEDETTNKSEAWNSASKGCMVMKPSIWSVINTFKKEESLARSRMQSAAMDTLQDSNPGRTKKREKRKASLKAVVGKFGSIPLKEWFNMAIAFYNDEMMNE